MMLTKTRIPPLQSGDRLTLEEFEFRYEAMPDIRAELIEGEVYVSSPVYFDHADPHADVILWLGSYGKLNTPGILVVDNASLVLDEVNELQPDAMAYIHADCGGGVTRLERGLLEGTPEFVFEIASTSANIDLGTKLRAYQKNGVSEYVVWRVHNDEIDWFINRRGKFQRLAPDSDGILKSLVLPGLWLDVLAMIEHNHTQVHAILQRGIESTEHAKFVQKLAGKRKK